ncbi:DUF2239 domain-containing protein [Kaistia algarum]|uniref:DUF2239 family protein n=1 Tax=Kaistia algarum TaxID=2083279 RepID=UPI000CE90B36|nr:DUF2239 family protein [Kaistia algarum]MCX5513237.1 DUF2239 family protein [Kaistia algarum]PPE81301.1 DUF2239 domain-containing protein [Kaistia algarum]
MKVVSTLYCTAFCGLKRVASGLAGDVAVAVKGLVDRGETVAIFDDATSRPIEIDFRGTAEEVRARIDTEPETVEAVAKTEPADMDIPAARGRGRPKLGVVAREVTLLPRHWEWLGRQPGGASVALRKLVDEARRVHGERDRKRDAQEAANRFMMAMAGDQPRFEDASRALFASDAEAFDALTELWPADIRDHSRGLAAAAFAAV